LPRPSDVGRTYQSAVQRARTCCKRIDRLFQDGHVKAADCDLIYESAFLNSIGRFEALLNHLLREFVCGAASRIANQHALVDPRSRDAFDTILTSGRQYIELMPYKTCVDTAKRFLRDGKPFSDVVETDRHILSQAMLVRNAIAHRSESAIGKFRRDVSGVSAIVAHRQFPGPYLRRMYRSHPQATWNDLYLDTFEKVGRQLALAW
jgi:hypothetical protein